MLGEVPIQAGVGCEDRPSRRDDVRGLPQDIPRARVPCARHGAEQDRVVLARVLGEGEG